jgi:8-amino-7-oxononanoate synthase
MTRRQSVKYEMESRFGSEIVLSGKRFINFGGCGYLGLHNRPQVAQAGCEAIQTYGIVSGINRHYDVSNAPILDVEDRAADYFGTEAAIYLPSGYLTGIVAVWGIADRVDAIFLDSTAHYSLRDAARLAGKPVYEFAHLDPADLRAQIESRLKDGQRPLVLSDGVFPTFGELAPVKDYLQVVEPRGGMIFLDDAHSLGAVGPNGRGTSDHFGVTSGRVLFGGTLSKAFGAYGGIIPGTREFIDRLRSCPIVRGATAPPAPCAAAGAKSLEIALHEPGLRRRLWDNVRMLKDGVRDMGIPMNDTEVPIVTFAMGSAEATGRVHKGLLERGIFVFLSHYVGAPQGGALRHAVFADHTPQHIRRLLEAIRDLR